MEVMGKEMIYCKKGTGLAGESVLIAPTQTQRLDASGVLCMEIVYKKGQRSTTWIK